MQQESLTSLSDDEKIVARLSDDEPLDVQHHSRPEKKRPVKASLPVNASQGKRQQLARLVGSLCACARLRKTRARFSCFRQFQGSVDELVQLHARLQSLHKQDMDNEVGQIKF